MAKPENIKNKKNRSVGTLVFYYIWIISHA